MATSGTISSTVFETRKVIEHAFRKMRMVPSQITAEYIEVASDLLYLLLSTLAADGIKLWNIDKILLPLYQRQQSVLTPPGTVDVLNCLLRTASQLTATGNTVLESEGDATNAFDGDLTTVYTQAAPLGWAGLQLPTAQTAQVYTFGFMWAGADTNWDFVFEYSDDGVTWSTCGPSGATGYTDYPLTNGGWVWFDIEGVTEHQYYRLRSLDAITPMSVRQIAFMINPTEINLAQLNRDDYANLPTKNNIGRPTQFWYDKQRPQPYIVLWPAPDLTSSFHQLVVYRQRQVQDVGSLTQELEIPQRWYLAIVFELAKMLVTEIKEADLNLLPVLTSEADEAMTRAWTGESDGSGAKFVVKIGCYTA